MNKLELKITEYINSNKEDFLINDTKDLSKLLTPRTLLFKQNGEIIFLFDCAWDIEHGIGVNITSGYKIGSQDLFLFSMRDKLKNEKYFKKELEGIDIDIDIDLDTSDGDIPDWFGLYISYFAKLMTKYSMGKDVALLINDYNNIIDTFIKSFDKDMTSYNSILSALSLSVIFNIKNIKKLEPIIKRSKQSNDYIIQFLLNSKNYNDYKIRWKDMFPIKDIIEDCKNNNKEEAENKMKNYLDNWYNNNEDAYWYETHKSKAKIYFGYWCLEAAALTYLLDLDDSEYLDNQYYPKDLVIYARNNKRKLF